MKQKMLTVALLLGCVILLAICYVAGSKSDREAPKIKIEDMDIAYTEGEDESELLEGVTASDNKDGNLTDQIFVEKILPIDDNTAVVYYAVLDQSNNVGTASRKIKYKKTENSSSENVENSPEDQSEDATSKSEEEYGVPQAEGTPDITPDGEQPVLALVTDSVKLKKGDSFDPVSVVWGVVDDEDSEETLYQHIHVEGEYDTENPGSYEIQYYVSDSDGNTSDPQIVTLTVE